MPTKHNKKYIPTPFGLHGDYWSVFNISGSKSTINLVNVFTREFIETSNWTAHYSMACQPHDTAVTKAKPSCVGVHSTEADEPKAMQRTI